MAAEVPAPPDEQTSSARDSRIRAAPPDQQTSSARDLPAPGRPDLLPVRSKGEGRRSCTARQPPWYQCSPRLSAGRKRARPVHTAPRSCLLIGRCTPKTPPRPEPGPPQHSTSCWPSPGKQRPALGCRPSTEPAAGHPPPGSPAARSRETTTQSIHWLRWPGLRPQSG